VHSPEDKQGVFTVLGLGKIEDEGEDLVLVKRLGLLRGRRPIALQCGMGTVIRGLRN
jgi:hypothetical protein